MQCANSDRWQLLSSLRSPLRNGRPFESTQTSRVCSGRFAGCRRHWNQRQAEAAERAAAEREAQQLEDEAERTYRELVVAEMEKSILADAKERVTTGLLTGPIMEVSCTPMAGGSTDDLTALTGSYDCIAVNEKHDDGTASGYRFSATTNWDDASYSWHLGG